jgi:chromosome segregation ATPase
MAGEPKGDESFELFRTRYPKEFVDLTHRLKDFEERYPIYDEWARLSSEREGLCAKRVQLSGATDLIERDLLALSSKLTEFQREKVLLAENISAIQGEIANFSAKRDSFVLEKSSAEADIQDLSAQLLRLTDEKARLEATRVTPTPAPMEAEETAEAKLSKALEAGTIQFEALKKSFLEKIHANIVALENKQKELVSCLELHKEQGNLIIAAQALELQSFRNTHAVKITERQPEIVLLTEKRRKIQTEIAECNQKIAALTPTEEGPREAGKARQLLLRATDLFKGALSPSKADTESFSGESGDKASSEESLEALRARKNSLDRELADLTPQLDVLEKQLQILNAKYQGDEERMQERHRSVILPLRQRKEEMKSELESAKKQIPDLLAFSSRLSSMSVCGEKLTSGLPVGYSKDVDELNQHVEGCIQLRSQLEEVQKWRIAREGGAPSHVACGRTRAMQARIDRALAKKDGPLNKQILSLQRKMAEVEKSIDSAKRRFSAANDSMARLEGDIRQREDDTRGLVAQIAEIERCISDVLSEIEAKEREKANNISLLEEVRGDIERIELPLISVSPADFRKKLEIFSQVFESEPYGIGQDKFDFKASSLSGCVSHLAGRWNEARSSVEPRLLAAAARERQAAEAAAEAVRQAVAAQERREDEVPAPGVAPAGDQAAAPAQAPEVPPVNPVATQNKAGLWQRLKAALMCLLYLFGCKRAGARVAPAVLAVATPSAEQSEVGRNDARVLHEASHRANSSSSLSSLTSRV